MHFFEDGDFHNFPDWTGPESEQQIYTQDDQASIFPSAFTCRVYFPRLRSDCVWVAVTVMKATCVHVNV